MDALMQMHLILHLIIFFASLMHERCTINELMTRCTRVHHRKAQHPSLLWSFDKRIFCSRRLEEKEVIQPHLPVRLPCYDFTLVTSPALGALLLAVRVTTSGWASFHGVTGGVYKAREQYSPPCGWPAITSDSAFMQASCSLQSELRPGFWGWRALARLHPIVPAIVARVSPRT